MKVLFTGCTFNEEKLNELRNLGIEVSSGRMDYNDEFINLPCDKFIITPHNAYNSSDAVVEMERMLIESLTDVNNGIEIRNTVK